MLRLRRSRDRRAGALRATVTSGMVVATVGACGRPSDHTSGARGGTISTHPPAIILTDVTSEVGLDFVHDPGADRSYFMPETIGAGCAFLDYDGDGDLDIYLVQSGSRDSSGPKRRNRLYRQEADGTFHDVTAETGLGNEGYGQGVAVGDYDSDGDVDVYVTNYGRDTLYRNEGGHRFADVTDETGVGTEGWSSSAVFVDYDGDRHLDLYVVRYLEYDPNKVCSGYDGATDYCGPLSFDGLADVLYRNRGDGTFADASSDAGIGSIMAAGLGVIGQDLNGDGRIDFYVANDGEANQLWENRGDGTFVDRALEYGVAVNAMGAPEAGMGIAAGDVDGDGDLDLFLTHLVDETNTLYISDTARFFSDRTSRAGLAAAGRSTTGFGTALLDLDHDGALDIVIVNGAVKRRQRPYESALSAYWRPYGEPNLVLRNTGDGSFTDVSERIGSFTSEIEVGRGLAVGDVDADGDLDLLLTNVAGRSRLYRNDSPAAGHWLIVRTFDAGRQRDAHGATVTVVCGGNRFVRLAQPGYGYLSSHDPRAHFGLPRDAEIEAILVRWPDGTEERFDGVATNQTIVLERGAGR